jgi:hypothetical protein
MARFKKKKKSKNAGFHSDKRIHAGAMMTLGDSFISKIWADMGLVHVISGHQDRKQTMKPQVAAARLLGTLQLLQNPNVPENVRKSIEKMAKRVDPVIRKAFHQQECKEESTTSKRTRAIINMVQTGTASGRPRHEVVDTRLEAQANELCARYFTLDEDDVLDVLKNKSLTQAVRMTILREAHEKNLDQMSHLASFGVETTPRGKILGKDGQPVLG